MATTRRKHPTFDNELAGMTDPSMTDHERNVQDWHEIDDRVDVIFAEDAYALTCICGTDVSGAGSEPRSCSNCGRVYRFVYQIETREDAADDRA